MRGFVLSQSAPSQTQHRSAVDPMRRRLLTSLAAALSRPAASPAAAGLPALDPISRFGASATPECAGSHVGFTCPCATRVCSLVMPVRCVQAACSAQQPCVVLSAASMGPPLHGRRTGTVQRRGFAAARPCRCGRALGKGVLSCERGYLAPAAAGWLASAPLGPATFATFPAHGYNHCHGVISERGSKKVGPKYWPACMESAEDAQLNLC